MEANKETKTETEMFGEKVKEKGKERERKWLLLNRQT